MIIRLFTSKIIPLILFLGLVGCKSTDYGYEGMYTSMVGPRVQSSSTSGYGLASRAAKRNKLKKPYFIEFRARNALTYGHTFVVFGPRDRKGGVPTLKGGILDPKYVEISGLHPKADSPSVFMAGHVVPVPALTNASDGDFEEAYVTARYRINLTEAEFKQVVKVVQAHKRRGTLWSGPLYACVHYTAAIAHDLGLKGGGMHLPERWVKNLKQRNGSNPKLSIRLRNYKAPKT